MRLNCFVFYLFIQGQKGEPGDVPIVSVSLTSTGLHCLVSLHAGSNYVFVDIPAGDWDKRTSWTNGELLLGWCVNAGQPELTLDGTRGQLPPA